jgi:hypothetical protein
MYMKDCVIGVCIPGYQYYISIMIRADKQDDRSISFLKESLHMILACGVRLLIVLSHGHGTFLGENQARFQLSSGSRLLPALSFHGIYPSIRAVYDAFQYLPLASKVKRGCFAVYHIFCN